MLESMFMKVAETSFGVIVSKIFARCSGDKSCKM